MTFESRPTLKIWEEMKKTILKNNNNSVSWKAQVKDIR